MSTATDVLSEHDDWPEAKPLPAADSAQARAPHSWRCLATGTPPTPRGAGGAGSLAGSMRPLSRYFTRTVGAGGVCVVIVLRLERYMGHCECQLNTCSTQTPTDLRSPSHCTLTITHLAPGCATGMTILPDAGAK
jgi:hypothetical protein